MQCHLKMVCSHLLALSTADLRRVEKVQLDFLFWCLPFDLNSCILKNVCYLQSRAGIECQGKADIWYIAARRKKGQLVKHILARQGIIAGLSYLQPFWPSTAPSCGGNPQLVSHLIISYTGDVFLVRLSGFWLGAPAPSPPSFPHLYFLKNQLPVSTYCHQNNRSFLSSVHTWLAKLKWLWISNKENTKLCYFIFPLHNLMFEINTGSLYFTTQIRLKVFFF